MTNWIRGKRKPRKQDEPTSGAMTNTSHLSNNCGDYTKPPTHVKNFVYPKETPEAG